MVQPYEIYKLLCKLKLQKASVSHELPVRILREFAVELSTPLANILNSAFQLNMSPQMWKYAEITPVPKSYPP